MVLKVMRRHSAGVGRRAGSRSFGLVKEGIEFVANFQTRTIDGLFNRGLIAAMTGVTDQEACYHLTAAGIEAADRLQGDGR